MVKPFIFVKTISLIYTTCPIKYIWYSLRIRNIWQCLPNQIEQGVQTTDLLSTNSIKKRHMKETSFF